MDFDTLGNIGEFLGGVGVVVTLGYLAVQIRHNSRVAALAAGHSIASGVNGFLERFALDPELHSLWSRGIESPESLDEAELDRFHRLLVSLFVRSLDAHRHGELDAEIAERFDHLVRHYLQLAAVRSWWEIAKEPIRSMKPDLVSYIDQQLLFADHRDSTAAR